MSPFRAALVVLLALALVAPVEASPAPKPIRAHLRVTKNLSPGEVTVYLSIPFNRDNRRFDVVANCDGVEYTRSSRQLDDLSDRLIDPITFTDLPGCFWVFVAVLYQADGHTAYSDPMPARIVCRFC